MRRHAFTLIELLVVISIIALLIAILLPAMGTAQRSARASICLSNQRQVVTAMSAHAIENDQQFPQVLDGDAFSSGNFYTWGGTLFYRDRFLDSSEYLHCPSAGVPSGADRSWDPSLSQPINGYNWSARYTYGMRSGDDQFAVPSLAPIDLDQVRTPSEYWVLADTASSGTSLQKGDGIDGFTGFYILDRWQHIQMLHLKRTNITYADGSVRANSRQDVSDKVAEDPVIHFLFDAMIFPDGSYAN